MKLGGGSSRLTIRRYGSGPHQRDTRCRSGPESGPDRRSADELAQQWLGGSGRLKEVSSEVSCPRAGDTVPTALHVNRTNGEGGVRRGMIQILEGLSFVGGGWGVAGMCSCRHDCLLLVSIEPERDLRMDQETDNAGQMRSENGSARQTDLEFNQRSGV